jgi:hypothetical protein
MACPEVSPLEAPMVRAPLIIDPIVALLLNEFIERRTELNSTLGTIVKKFPPGEIVFDELQQSAIVSL